MNRDIEVHPIMWVCKDPLRAHIRDYSRPPLGSTMADIAPRDEGALVVRFNGAWMLPTDWAAVTIGPGDLVEWFIFPADDNTKRSVLTIAVLAAAIYTGGATATFGAYAQVAGAVVGVVGQLAINAILPPTAAAQAEQGATAQLYSSSLRGNQAAIDEPIWKIFGRRKLTPPFAAPPYSKFVPKADPGGTGNNSDQYFYALFAVGEGRHTLERELIGDTDINSYRDVTVHAYLAPGVAPTTVKANITTVAEASNIMLDSGRFTPAYPASSPNTTTKKLHVDMMAPRGLGSGGTLTVNWRIDTQDIDDFGATLSGWTTLASESRSANTNAPQRWSSEYTLTPARRVAVRIVRTDVKNTSASALHDLALAALRSELNQPAPLNPNVAHYEVVMRSSEQLSGASQQQFSLVLTGQARSDHGRRARDGAPTRHRATPPGTSSKSSPTASPAWAMQTVASTCRASMT